MITNLSKCWLHNQIYIINVLCALVTSQFKDNKIK